MFDELEKIARTRMMKEVARELGELGPEWAAKLEADPTRLRTLTRIQEAVGKGTIPDVSRRQIRSITGPFSPAAQVNLSPAPTARTASPPGVAAAKLHKQKHHLGRNVKDRGARREHDAYVLAGKSLRDDAELFPGAWRPDIATAAAPAPTPPPRPAFLWTDDVGRQRLLRDWDPLARRVRGEYAHPKMNRRMGGERREIAAEQQAEAVKKRV